MMALFEPPFHPFATTFFLRRTGRSPESEAGGCAPMSRYRYAILGPGFYKETDLNTRRSLAMAAAMVLLAVGSLTAHHAISAVFDTSRQIKLVGELTRVDWVNPHVFIHLTGKNTAGAAVQWKVESSPPAW